MTHFINTSKKLDDLIISLLHKGPRETLYLLSKIKGVRAHTTKQGFYAALRKLRDEEIVVIYKGTVGLNTTWINDMHSMFEIISASYTPENNSFEVLKLKNGQSVSYTFSTAHQLDIFWGHVQNIFMQNTSDSKPIYSFDPHYWLYLAHQRTERKLLAHIARSKRRFLMTVGGETALDKIIKRDLNTPYLQCNIKRLFPKDNLYITVIDEYIVEVHLDKNLVNIIDNIFKNNNAFTRDVIEQLEQALKIKGRNRIKVSKDKIKAEKFRKKLSRDFI